MKTIAISDLYRKKTGRCGGVVIIYNGSVSGWMNELRNPDHWAPGCIAVDADNNQFISKGGNDSDGASEWVSI